MTEQQIMNNNTNSNIPVSEVYWSLVDKADKKFSKIRDLPYYERNRFFLASSSSLTFFFLLIN
jgi:hypothetical protein